MTEQAPTVFVVDDELDVRIALERLLSSHDMKVATFSSPQEFLRSYDPAVPACLVLDLALDGESGLDAQTLLAERARDLPVVFLTGHGDIASGVTAMKHGASDFLTKPVDEAALLSAIRSALDRQQVERHRSAEHERLVERLAALTVREREVLQAVVAGRLNKQIAGSLGTTEKTVKFHRANVMRKLGVRSVAELVRLCERAGAIS